MSPRPVRDRLLRAAPTAAAAVFSGLLALSEFSSQPPSAERLVWEVGTGVAAYAALLLFRHRHPVWLAVGLVLLGPLSVVVLGATFLAVFTVAAHRSWRVTAAVGALGVASICVVFGLAASTPETDLRQAAASIVLLYAVLAVAGMLVRSQRQLVRSLQDRARQAEEGQRLRVEEARHTERERLAREMHDVLAHRISLLAVHAGALEYHPSTSPEATRAAGVIRRCAYEALEDLREVLGMLRADESGDSDGRTNEQVRPQPTLADLGELVAQARQAGADVELDDRVTGRPVPDRIGRHAYRIVQEGLTNARKHAPGSRVRVVVDARDGGLLLEISNRLPAVAGVGHIPGSGAGLVGLRERVDLVGGRLDCGPTPGGEFRVRTWLPWPG